MVSLGWYSQAPALQETSAQTIIAILGHAPEHALGLSVVPVSAQV